MLTFKDRILSFDILPEETITYNFNNNITISENKTERCIPNKLEYLVRFSFGNLTLKECELEQYRSFIEQSKNTIDSFFYKSSIDYETRQVGIDISNSDGYTLSELGLAYLDPEQTDTLRLFKVRRLAYNGRVIRTLKPIYPDPSTIEIYEDDVLIDPLSYNFVDDDVQIAGLNPSARFTWSGEFFHLVRFANLGQTIEKKSFNTYEVNGISLVEVKKSHGIFLEEQFNSDFQSFDGSFTFDFEPSIIKTIDAPVYEKRVNNDFESRRTITPYINENFKFLSTLINGNQKDYLVSFFLIAKGMLNRFTFKNRPVRFKEDSLSITKISADRLSFFASQGMKIDLCATHFTYNDFEFCTGKHTIGDIDKDTTISFWVNSTQYDPDQLAIIVDRVDELRDYLTSTVYAEPGATGSVIYQQMGGGSWLSSYTFDVRFKTTTKLITVVITDNDDRNGGYYQSFPTSQEPRYINKTTLEPTNAWNNDIALLNQHGRDYDSLYILHLKNPRLTTEANWRSFQNFRDHFYDVIDSKTPYQTAGLKSTGKEQIIKFISNVTLNSSFIDIFSSETASPRTWTTVMLLSKEGLFNPVSGSPLGYGFTSLDANVETPGDGNIFRPNFSIDVSATDQKVNLATDNITADVITTDLVGLTETQLSAGIFKGFQVRIALIDFMNAPATVNLSFPASQGTSLLVGLVGEVTVWDHYFSIEMRSFSDLLNKPISNKAMPICSHDFGDSLCGLDLVALGLQYDDIAITGFNTANREISIATANFTNNFINGSVYVKQGINLNLRFRIEAVINSTTIRLKGDFAGDFAINDEVDIKAFCAKNQVTCRDDYLNFIHYGGFPIGGNWMRGLSQITTTAF